MFNFCICMDLQEEITFMSKIVLKSWDTNSKHYLGRWKMNLIVILN